MKKLKKNKNILVTFLIGMVVLITIYILQKIAPFGKNTMLTIDFYHQYGPMLGELYDRVKNGASLLYSFSLGLGLPFFRNFLNYLSSPFNIIIFLFSRDNLVMSYSIIIGLKAVCAATTMVYYLNRKFKNNNLYLVPIGLFYAFSAYFIAYYWNLMWLDGMVFLPLVTLGIERIIDRGKILLYIFSLATMLLANYFIGYMICLFSVIYFIAYFLLKVNIKKHKENFKKIAKFTIASLLAGGLGAFLLLPLFTSISSISATGDFFPTSQYYGFGISDFIMNHLTGVGSTVLASGISNAPNVSCGILSVMLLMLFIINPKITLKVKICYLSILLIFITSFLWAPLDFIWQAFHVPNDLPYRYSFLYTFVLLIISAYSLINIKYIKYSYIIYAFGFTLIYIVVAYLISYENINQGMLILNAIVIIIYFILYLLYSLIPKISKYAVYAFILIASIECVLYVNNNWEIEHDIDTFNSNYTNSLDGFNYLNKTDASFYRTAKNDRLTLNDPSWFNYYGISTFSSMAYEKMAVFQNHMGLPGNYINSYYYEQTTPIYDTIFGIKYLIGNNKSEEYKSYYVDDNMQIYENSKYLGLLYGVKEDLLYWYANYGEPIENQNNFIYLATGIEDTFEILPLIDEQIISEKEGAYLVKYTYEKKGDKIYFYPNDAVNYIYINNNIYYTESDYADIYTIDEKIDIKYYHSYDESYLISQAVEDDIIELYVSYRYYYDEMTPIKIYSLNQEKYDEFYDLASNNVGDIIEFSESYIKSKIRLDKNMVVFTSIAYDEGWHVYVDGKEVETVNLSDALLCFKADKGTHTIELKYSPKYLKTGIFISVISFVITFTYILKIRRNTKKGK